MPWRSLNTIIQYGQKVVLFCLSKRLIELKRFAYKTLLFRLMLALNNCIDLKALLLSPNTQDVCAKE